MSVIARALKTIESEELNFFLSSGHRILLDKIHLMGEVYVPELGMTILPFLKWIQDGYLEVEDSDIMMETYEYSMVRIEDEYTNLEPMFHQMLMSKAHLGLTVAEAGVYMGENAEKILKLLPVNMLYLIDPYDENPDYQPGNPHLNEAKEFARKRLEPYSGRIHWIYETSQTALPNLHDLDAVYHDSDHRRKCVTEELPLGYDAVKAGGWWGGHDYKQTLKGGCAVKSCVDEFVINHNLSPLMYSATMLNWWVRKPLEN